MPDRRDPVAIVIPCFNYGLFLEGAILSALGQTWPVDVLVVDDGSEDDTAAVVRRFQGRVRYVHQAHQGVCRARNVGARLTTCRHVVFLDADDELRSTFVEATLRHLSSHPEAAYVYTGKELFGSREGLMPRREFDLERLKQRNFISPATLLPTDLVRRFGFDDAFRDGLNDWDFYLRLAEHGFTGVLLDEPLQRYRQHPGSMTARYHAENDAAREERARLRARIARRHWRLLGPRRVVRDHLAVVYRAMFRLSRRRDRSAPGRRR